MRRNQHCVRADEISADPRRAKPVQKNAEQLLRERTPASGEWQVNALNRWGRVGRDGERGNPWLALAAGRRCELARLGKLGDGSARRDVGQ